MSEQLDRIASLVDERLVNLDTCSICHKCGVVRPKSELHEMGTDSPYEGDLLVRYLCDHCKEQAK